MVKSYRTRLQHFTDLEDQVSTRGVAIVSFNIKDLGYQVLFERNQIN